MSERDNIFKDLETDKKLPEETKKQVLADVESAQLAAELADLFGNKFFSVIGNLFRTRS